MILTGLVLFKFFSGASASDAPPVVEDSTPVLAAGGIPGRARKRRKVLVGNRMYEVDNLRDVEFLLKRVVRQEAEPVLKALAPRKRVVDRVSADVVPDTPVAVPMASVAVDWTPLIKQLEAQDGTYVKLLMKAIARQEEEDIEEILLLH